MIWNKIIIFCDNLSLSNGNLLCQKDQILFLFNEQIKDCIGSDVIIFCQYIKYIMELMDINNREKNISVLYTKLV